MKLSYNWLREFIDISVPPEELSDILTQTGLEVEGLEEVEKIRGGLEGLILGEVMECIPHPNADKLKLCKVDVGSGEHLSIVCGAPNVAQGQKIVVAPVNTTIYPVSGDPFKIKRAKIRGVESSGMICAEDEIGLGQGHDGVIVLETKKPNGTAVSDLFETGKDSVFEIGLTPNRGDAASHLGAARDIKAYFKKELNDLKVKPFEKSLNDPIEVEVLNSDACFRYSGVTLRGVKIAPSPDWLQWRLRAIGQEPINNIVDITNYILNGLGQPLHAFDAQKVKGKISVKTLDEGSRFITLDEKERKLSGQDLMICDEKGGLCIAGVFGGLDSGITESTTDIFLESACFSPDYVRATSLRHGLSTDASFRFERATDPEMTVTALRLATQLILDLAGGKITSELIDIYPEKIQPVSIKTKFSTFHRLIGEQLTSDRIIEILNLLDIETQDLSENGFTAIVPSYRSEVTRQADLVEEVLRIHGFNNISLDESTSTSFLAEFKEKEPYKIQAEVSSYLAGLGFHEISTNSLTNASYNEKLKLGEGEVVGMMNFSSEDLNVLKSSMLYTGLEVVKHNLNRRNTNLRLFEFGKTYHSFDGSHKEKSWMTLYMAGKTHEDSWKSQTHDSSFHDLMGHLTSVLDWLGGINFESIKIENDLAMIYGMELKLYGNTIGKIGKLNSSITDYFEIDQEVFYAQLLWDKLVKYSGKVVDYKPVSKFPEVKRDLSLVLEKSVTFREIEEIAFNSEKKLLNRINVFSTYEGEQLETNQKSYAISFFLQDQTKTLTDKQIDKVMNHLMSEYENKLGAIIRK